MLVAKYIHSCTNSITFELQTQSPTNTLWTTTMTVPQIISKLIARTKMIKPQSIIPILNWGLKYDIKNALVGDVIAGITVAVMQVLSSMADAQLAKIDVVRGLYCSIFPVIIYAIFGPSRHISIGRLKRCM